MKSFPVTSTGIEKIGPLDRYVPLGGRKVFSVSHYKIIGVLLNILLFVNKLCKALVPLDFWCSRAVRRLNTGEGIEHCFEVIGLRRHTVWRYRIFVL